MTPLKGSNKLNAPPQSDEQNVDDPPPLPKTALLTFFHTTMKETTSHACSTSLKNVIQSENGATKVDYQFTEEEISHCSNDNNSNNNNYYYYNYYYYYYHQCYYYYY